jgi:4-amino-4-deoxy-L-arabinose transferase-like glycosyltransferase
LLWLFHSAVNTVWLFLDNFPPTWDSAHHLTMTLMWLDYVKSPSLVGLKAVMAASSYPALPYLVVTPVYLLFGRSADAAVLGSSALWLGLLLFGTYGLGKEVYSRKAGLLAAVIVSLYPIIIALERDFWLDLQLASAVALALWALLRVGDFENRNRAILLGLILGIGTWIKWPFSFFVFAPVLAVILQVWRRADWSRLRLANLALCLVLAGMLAAGQYLSNLLFLSRDVYNFNNVLQLVTGFAEAANHPAWYTREGAVYHLTALVNHQASFFFALLFLFSVPVFFKRAARGRWVLGLSIIVPYILATLLPIKEQRITVPYLPAVAVISAVGLSKIRWKTLRIIAIVLVLSFGLFQWWVVSWGVSFLPDHIYWGNSWVYLAVFDQHYVRSPRDYSLKPGDWKIEQLLGVIEIDAAVNDIPFPIQVPLIANAPAYNPNTLNYYSALYDVDIQFIYVWSWMGKPISLDSYPYSYLIWKSGQNVEIEGWDQADVRRAEEFLADQQGSLTPIYRSPLPDGSDVHVFRRVENPGIMP